MSFPDSLVLPPEPGSSSWLCLSADGKNIDTRTNDHLQTTLLVAPQPREHDYLLPHSPVNTRPEEVGWNCWLSGVVVLVLFWPPGVPQACRGAGCVLRAGCGIEAPRGAIGLGVRSFDGFTYEE